MERVRAFVSLGSNMGEPAAYLDAALLGLAELPKTRLAARSARYETAPVGKTDQPWFLNEVAELETSLAPHELLRGLFAIENRNGRVRTIRWGPRTLDLDLLLYGDLRHDDAELTLPHPRLTERAFVLVPLAELAPELVVDGQPVREWCARRRDQQLRRVDAPLEG
ncbi:MAG TPA: 2-amino-4-hydroxy-6-hydroxymethyldihydropteridine diphosphokinase [Limnochordia bacterium]|nr:2-amino-4-hydroxy-6-hydroxymethyldihydropteridine diphosphokinase [Limnochordia bacterium]